MSATTTTAFRPGRRPRGGLHRPKAADWLLVAVAIIGAIATLLVGGTIATFTGRSIVRTALRQLGWAVVACGATWLIGSWLGASIT